MPGVTFVLGDTAAEAQERAAEIRRQQVSPQTAILALEQIWGVDLSGYDPDGPLPDIDPDPGSQLVQGRVRHADPLAIAAKWRALSEEKGLSIRQTVIETTGRQSFIGTPEAVAGEMARFVRDEAADGFILVPHLTPGGLDEFVDRVVPLLQERGVFRTAYTGRTLRDHLGLSLPGRPGIGGTGGGRTGAGPRARTPSGTRRPQRSSHGVPEGRAHCPGGRKAPGPCGVCPVGFRIVLLPFAVVAANTSGQRLSGARRKFPSGVLADCASRACPPSGPPIPLGGMSEDQAHHPPQRPCETHRG